MKAEARLTSSLTKLLPVASQASIGLLGSRICSRALVQSSTHPLQHGAPVDGFEMAGEAMVRRNPGFGWQLGQRQGARFRACSRLLTGHATLSVGRVPGALAGSWSHDRVQERYGGQLP